MNISWHDAMALACVTDQITYLEDGDVVDLQLGKVWISSCQTDVVEGTQYGRFRNVHAVVEPVAVEVLVEEPVVETVVEVVAEEPAAPVEAAE